MAKKNDNYVDLKTQPIPEGQHLLEVDDLKMYFHTEDGVVHAGDGVSYTRDRGETLGVVGESGSGKSVTAMTIMGLISMPPGKIEGGSVTYRGHDLLSMSEEEMQHVRGNDIAMIFQDPMTSLNPVYKIGRQVGEGLRLHRGYSKQEALKRATELRDLVAYGLMVEGGGYVSPQQGRAMAENLIDENGYLAVFQTVAAAPERDCGFFFKTQSA